MFRFVTILLAVVTLMHVYVFWRAASVPYIKRKVSRKGMISTGAVVWALFFAGIFMGHDRTGTAALVLELPAMHWLGLLFLLTVSFLAVDIPTVFGCCVKRHVLFLRGFALVAGILLSIIALVQGLRPPVVRDHDVHLAGLPPEMDGTVIVAMSDLHVGSLIGRTWLKERVAQVHELEPDMVVLLGDIFEGHGRPEEELLDVLRSLKAPLGVWIVLGNHEFYARRNTDGHVINYDGIPVLSNTWKEVRPGFVLAGVDDLTFNHRSGQGGDPVSKALKDRTPGATVLLSHTPWYAEKIAKEGVGLMLSGHTHGGQIWPFGHVVKLFYPLLAGRYEVNGMTAIVCRGTGSWGPRMRLWHPGEILRVRLSGTING